MAKYVIVKRVYENGKPVWAAHRYDIFFKLFGIRVEQIVCTFESSKKCKESLKVKVANKGKFEVIEIIDL